jgi:hypothetical protein
MRKWKKDVTTRPLTGPCRKILVLGGYALALARRFHVSWRALTFAQTLTITLRLLPPLLPALLRSAVFSAGSPPPPAFCIVATPQTAKKCFRMPWPERPFTSLEQTTPRSRKTTLWPFADVPNKMMVVHGSRLLPMFKSRSEASTSLRGVASTAYLIPKPWLLIYKMHQSRVHTLAPWGGEQRVFCLLFLCG